jgi:periplasmic divalent cation tolerance protein
VSERLAACANIGAEVQSIYWWKGELENARETMVFFKTTAACFPRFEERLKGLHPYDVPEIICTGVLAGLPDYLQWVKDSCATVEVV